MENQIAAQRLPFGIPVRHARATLVRHIIGVAAGFVILTGWGGSASASGGAGFPPVATPTISTAGAQNGAVIITLTDSTSGATLYYTTDGTTPTSTSTRYFAPFLVSSSLTLKAIAVNLRAHVNSSVASRSFALNMASGTLVWSEEFSSSGSPSSQPNPSTWRYDTGTNCCGNHELETYCAWGSTGNPCNPSNPNAFIGTDGYLHIVALHPSTNVYTSARLKTQGLFSFEYGRVEARMMLPESQGMWPAFWLLGNNIASVSWPACGEADVMEHIDGSNPPPYPASPPPGYDWVAGSVHGGTLTSRAGGSQKYHPAGFSAAAWHIYGMVWTKGQIRFYVDDPTNIYATFKPSNFNGTWPFDQGPMFILLNLAVGGDWPGKPDASTVLPSSMLVDYVRIYTYH